MKTILVIGDSCIDEFIYGEVDRLAPEAPVPIIVPQYTKTNAGMAGNVALNVKSLGMNVNLISNVHRPVKTRYVDNRTKNIMFRVDEPDEIGRVDWNRINNDNARLDLYDAIIISDYNKGFLHESDIDYICTKNNNVFLDTKKHLGEWCINAKLIKLNEIEYKNNKKYIDNLRIGDKLLVTLGGKGCVYNAVTYLVPQVEVKNISGAGDTFISALVVKYLETNDMEQAINYAQECATIAVQKLNVVAVGDYLTNGKN